LQAPRKHAGRRFVIAVPYLWLTVLFLVPFIIVFKISFSETRLAMPPYAPLIEWREGVPAAVKLYFANYRFLFTDRLYFSAYLYSLKVAAVSTLWCLLIGYPMAYAIARAKTVWRNLLLMLIVLPFWTSFLLRVYAWIGLLKNNGVINNVLLGLGVIHEPLTLMQTDFAVYVGIVYSYLPFMILPLYANLEKHDSTLLEAASDLGARPWRAFMRVTLPLSIPGIVAGSLLVFIPAVGEYVIPSLLGRTDQLMIGRVLSDEFFANRDWPVASAVAILMLVLLVVPIMLFQRVQRRELEARS
jgi:putrescine transport system permease protein